MNWQHERSMTPNQFKWSIAKLCMSRAVAARYLNIDERHAYRMAHGQAIVPVPVVLILNSLVHHDEKLVVPRRPKGNL
jgi:hypothetical protein